MHERHLYDLDEMNAKVDRIINRVCKILVNELVEMIKNSNFFSKENKSTTITENRRVFMILKWFKQLSHSDQVYQTLNNCINEAEFKILIQKALKSKSLVSPGDKDFDKSKLPLSIFINGVIEIFLEGSLK